MYDEADLDWAFLHHEAELQELEQQAAQVPGAEAVRQEEAQRRAALQKEAERVLAEWDEQRRRDAEAATPPWRTARWWARASSALSSPSRAAGARSCRSAPASRVEPRQQPDGPPGGHPPFGPLAGPLA